MVETVREQCRKKAIEQRVAVRRSQRHVVECAQILQCTKCIVRSLADARERRARLRWRWSSWIALVRRHTDWQARQIR
jgi:ribosomal protein L18